MIQPPEADVSPYTPNPDYQFTPDGFLVKTDEMIAQMRQYHLDDAYVDGTEPAVFHGFVCSRKCGMTYPTIEDRMLKAADTCPGCILKSKWG